MKKVIVSVLAVVLLISIASTKKVNAASYFSTVGIASNGTGWTVVASTWTTFLNHDYGYAYDTAIFPTNYSYTYTEAYNLALQLAAATYRPSWPSLSYSYIPYNNTFILISGNVDLSSRNPDNYYGSLEDYENSLIPPEQPWYVEMWDTLKEELGNPAFWFGQWFIDLIDNVYGEEDDPTGPPKPPTSTHVQINNPTITPAPTPIPYTTVVIPKTDPLTGDTYYEENYYYINPSGTPIITSSPPTNPPSQNGSGNGTDYTPVGGDPYSIPQVSWLTNGVLDDGNNTMDGISSIADGMDSIDAIGSDYTNGMSAVQDATGTLPTSWLLLIGIAAAIPLIAGIVSRFLS